MWLTVAVAIATQGGAKAQQQQQTTGWTSGGAKPPSLKEIQEQEQREMLERRKQQKQAKAAAPAQQSGDGKNLQNLLSAWGFSSGESDIDNNNPQQPSWASMDETPSLREIQEQEAAQREMAQMEDQQRKRQQQQQQAQKANEVAWTGGRGTKKPTLAEIQAEELKQQQKRQKEMQHQHKQQLKAQREQLARFSSPWAGAAQVVRIPIPNIPSRKGHDGETHRLSIYVCRQQNDRPPRAALSR
jgi:hypothetical protein